jgi:hypothetical protein
MRSCKKNGEKRKTLRHQGSIHIYLGHNNADGIFLARGVRK